MRLGDTQFLNSIAKREYHQFKLYLDNANQSNYYICTRSSMANLLPEESKMWSTQCKTYVHMNLFAYQEEFMTKYVHISLHLDRDNLYTQPARVCSTHVNVRIYLYTNYQYAIVFCKDDYHSDHTEHFIIPGEDCGPGATI